jgi:HSP20 family molecular chaperone IbpA
MDLYRSGDHYVLHVDLPGVDPGSVDVSVDGGILTVKAHNALPVAGRLLSELCNQPGPRSVRSTQSRDTRQPEARM